MLLQINPTEEQLKFLKAIDEGDSASPTERNLSDAQKLFCIEYVRNGGDALAAARAVGYASDVTMSHKNMVHKGCLQLIRRLSVQNINTQLPQLFARLYQIAMDPKTSPRAAVDAINTLIDRVVAPHPKGPHTAIQINNGAGAEKGQAQVIIQELWSARADREQRKQAAHRAAGDIVDREREHRVSDIDGTMSDETDPALVLLEHIADGDGMGGGAFSGSRQVPSSIPAPPPAHDGNFTQEADDGENWSEENGSAPAGCDKAGGPGRGDGVAEEGIGCEGGGVGSDDACGAGFAGEVHAGFHAEDDEGFLSDVDGNEGVADDGSRARVVWGDIGASAGSEGGVSGSAGAGGIEFFDDD